ncbi:MAG: family 20 glycosylhydrolase [Bacteroidales bacterium]|jgi:hypothetical protein|nr:family 20 glycosylhydrolase [Bacteroidales bacterium]
MKKALYLFMVLLGVQVCTRAQSRIDSILPVRGLCIATPLPNEVDAFVNFIEHELVPAHFNLLMLRVDYHYAYQTHPELREDKVLQMADVKKIVRACKAHHITLVPQINLLGHQSWAYGSGKLLKNYPQFDETPYIVMDEARGDEPYVWPNPLGFFCKSYCPLHPDVHEIVFDLVDELMDVFEATWFHGGFDEVFILADSLCPRCAGKDPAELLAGEITLVRNHLAQQGQRLMIWGDRLINGWHTGIGEWQAAINHTERAVSLIPKDVVICDWHYEKAEQTPAYFAVQGLGVLSCPWNRTSICGQQLDDILNGRQSGSPGIASRFLGIMQTTWCSMNDFLLSYYSPSAFEMQQQMKRDKEDHSPFARVHPPSPPGAVGVKYMMQRFKQLNGE